MKQLKITLIAALLLISMSMKEAGGISWMDFNSGYEMAKKKKKLMLVDVYTDWCGWCKRMDRDAYEKSEIIEFVGKSFVAIKFNPEAPGSYKYEGKNYNGQELAGVIGNYQINGYPATVFMNPKTKKSELMIGYKNGVQLQPVLEEMVNKLGGK